MTITIDLKTGKVVRIQPLKSAAEVLSNDFHGLFPAKDGEEAELRNVRSRLLMSLAMEKDVYVEHGRLTAKVEGILSEHDIKVRYGKRKEVRRAEKKEAALVTPPHGMYRR